MMGLTPDPLVHTLFALFIFVLAVTLVVLVVWGPVFLYQHESIPKVIFLCLTCLYQQDSRLKMVESSKCLELKFLILFP